MLLPRLLLLLLLSGIALGSDYPKLLRQIETKYQKELPKVQASIIDPRNFPYLCSTVAETSGIYEPIVLMSPEDQVCLIQITDTIVQKVRVAVSYIIGKETKEEFPRTIGYRLHFYQINSNGNWFEYRNPESVTQLLDTVVVVQESKDKKVRIPSYNCLKYLKLHIE